MLKILFNFFLAKSFMDKILLLSAGILLMQSHLTKCDTIAEFLCQNQPPDTQLQHPEFCDVYLICQDNRAVEMRCDPGVMFNPTTNECDPEFTSCPLNRADSNDDEEEANESDVDEGEEEEEENRDEENEEGGDQEEEGQNGPAPGGGNQGGNNQNNQGPSESETSVCPRIDTNQVTFIVNKNDCSVYQLCYHGKPVLFQCSIGMHWSNRQKKCVPKELSECRAAQNNMEAGCPATGIKFMPHPNICQHFIYCLNGVQTIQRCEAFYHWDMNESRCKLKTLATCYPSMQGFSNGKNDKKNPKKN